MYFRHNIEIFARDNGQIAVQRLISGVVTDRFHTHDFRNPIKRTDRWIRDTQNLCSQPSANVVIEIPPVPELELTQVEDLELHKRIRSSQAEMIIKLREIKPAICDGDTLHNGRTISELMELANKVGSSV